METSENINKYPREIIRLFDEFVHGDIDRRGFIENAAKYSISAIAAGAMLNSLLPDFAAAQKIKPDDKRITTNKIKIDSPNGSGFINAYFVRPTNPKMPKKLPCVIVVHENRGLNPHIEDIARRIALEGFVVIAPDALTSLGGYPGNEDDARTKFQTLDQNKIKADFIAAANHARKMPSSNGKIGVIGFCYGGGMANYLATKLDYLRAAVPFYGAAADVALVPTIKAKLQLHFASDDQRFNEMWPPYEAALRAANKNYEAFTYDGTVHGFNNDTTPRYSESAAKLAWSRAIAFFKKELK